MRNTIEILFGLGVDQKQRLEWMKASGSSDQGGYDTYVDTATIRANGGTVKMWHLHDFKMPQECLGKTYLSSKSWVEYDLKNAQRRTLYFSWNAQPMGMGETVYRMDEPSEWRAVLPGSIAETLSKIASGEQPLPSESAVAH